MRFALFATLLVACTFTPGTLPAGDGAVDTVPDDADRPPPDGSVCTAASTTCASTSVLRTCPGAGQAYVDTPCAWGCTSSPVARCAELAPAGGWEMASSGDTTSFTNLDAVTLPDGAIVNSTSGQISGANGSGTFRAGMTGVVSGIDYERRALGTTTRFVAVFRARRFTITNLELTGLHAIAFIADEAIDVKGVIDAVPACLAADVRTPGPGGFAGGLNNFDGSPTPPDGGGEHGPSDDQGGGGGGHGSLGGSGGNNDNSGGAPYGTPQIALLVGGAGGGGGDDHANSGHGGGGGAALHFISNGTIEISAGGINAGACGGRAGSGGNDGGGGGGAGGTILIEAPTVTVSGTLAVNGGGGGGGNTGTTSTTGQSGQLSRTPAAGGAAGGGSSGGVGGAGAIVFGLPGTSESGGGGGGSVGRIRINTRAGAAEISGATLSPGPSDFATTYSEGTAAVR